ncbi:hypothetical protein PS15m_001608 [Mucor circinelloides]
MDGGFIKKLNNSGQGDCGFKALAQQMYHPENETKHNIVRSLMLETLKKNKALYTTCFGKGVFQYEACCEILSTPYRWFTTPECAQVAADNTFGRPIAEYTSEVFQGAECRTFLPLLEFMSSPNKINPGKTPLPLILQNQDQMHWFTVIYKKSHKLNYPAPAHWHNSEAMVKMGLKSDKGRSFWNRHLLFVKEKHAQQSNLVNTDKDSNIILINSDTENNN